MAMRLVVVYELALCAQRKLAEYSSIGMAPTIDSSWCCSLPVWQHCKFDDCICISTCNVLVGWSMLLVTRFACFVNAVMHGQDMTMVMG